MNFYLISNNFITDMSCQAIRNNGEQCTKPAKEKYDFLYCSKHKHWLEYDETPCNDQTEELEEELQEEEELEEIQEEIPKKQETKKPTFTMDNSGDIVMGGSDYMSHCDDNLVYKLMKYYHEKYANQSSLLLTITKVMEKLNSILDADDGLILTNIKQSAVNHGRFMGLVNDFTRYLPQYQKYEVMAKMSAIPSF